MFFTRSEKQLSDGNRRDFRTILVFPNNIEWINPELDWRLSTLETSSFRWREKRSSR